MNFLKKTSKLGALCLSLMVALSGLFACKKADDAKIIASIGEEEVSLALFKAAFESYAGYYQQMGADPYASKAAVENLQDMVSDALVADALVLHHARLESFELSEEEAAQVRASVESELAEIKSETMAQAEERYASDSSKSVEQHFDALIKEISAYYTGEEMTFEEYSREYLEQSLKTQLIENYYNGIIDSIEVSEADIEKWIATQRESDKKRYEEQPEAYFSDMNSYEYFGDEYDDLHPSAYVPEGYSRVLDIVVYPKDEIGEEYTNAMTQLNDIASRCSDMLFSDALEGSNANEAKISELIEEYKQLKAQTDAMLEDFQTESRNKIDEAYRLLEEGKSFTDVLMQYSEDSATVGGEDGDGCELFRTKGMLISLVHDCGTNDWSKTFKDIYRMTEKGKYSGVFTDDDGSLHIIYRGEDEIAGEVDASSLRDAAISSIRLERRDGAWNELMEEWRKDPELKVDIDAIRKVGIENIGSGVSY